VTDQAPPLELTFRNLLVGGGYTLLIFPAALGITLAVATAISGWGNETAIAYSLLVGVVAMVGAAIISLVAIPVLGIPLAAFAAWVARGSATIWHHLLAQFFAGAVAASILAVVYSSIESFGRYSGVERLILVAIVIVTGLTSALGWWLALRQSRKVRRERPFGEAYEDWG